MGVQVSDVDPDIVGGGDPEASHPALILHFDRLHTHEAQSRVCRLGSASAVLDVGLRLLRLPETIRHPTSCGRT